MFRDDQYPLGDSNFFHGNEWLIATEASARFIVQFRGASPALLKRLRKINSSRVGHVEYFRQLAQIARDFCDDAVKYRITAGLAFKSGV